MKWGGQHEQTRFNNLPLLYHPDPHPQRHIDHSGTGSDDQRGHRQKELEARRPAAKAISAAAPEPTKAIETKGTEAPADKMQALRARLGG